MRISSIFEVKARKVVAIMPGGFHPFHPGHKSLYDWAVNKFGKSNVYVAATDNTKERPFPFEIKKQLAAMAGVPTANFIQVKRPFNPGEYQQLLDNDTAIVFIKSEKNAKGGSDPESPFPDEMKIDKATKKPGNEPRYFRSYNEKDLNTYDEMGYLVYGPTEDFDFAGMSIQSASQLRSNWPNMSEEDKLKAAELMYPGNGEKAVKLLNSALGVKEPEMAESIELRHNFQPGKYKHSEENVTVEINKDGSVSFIQPQEWEIESDPEYIEWVEGLLAGNDWITTEVDEPEQTKNKRDLLNRNLRAKGHQIVPNKKGYNRKKERQMKFNDVYSEASFDMSPEQKKMADIGRLLMDYAETIKDPKDQEALTLSDEIGILGRALAEGRIRNVKQLLQLLPKLKSDQQEIANVVQQVFADYAEGKRSDLATKIKHDGATDDGEEEPKESAKKMHPREKLRRNFEKIAGYSLDDREKEYQAILDRYKKEKEEEKTEGVFDKDGMLGKFVKRDTGTNVTTGKPNAPTFMGVNVSTRDGKIKALKTQIQMAKRSAPKSGLTPKDVPNLEKKLAKLEKEKAMQGESVTEGSPYQDGVSVIQHLEAIVRDKQAKAVPFADGKGKVDMFTASAVTQVFDAVNEDNKRKVLNMIGTRDGFMKIAKFALGKIKEDLEEGQIDEKSKGLYYYVNKRKKAGTSRKKGHPKAPSEQDWKNAAKTAKESSFNEGKKKGVDKKACWDGYKYAGKEKKADGTYKDICKPMSAKEKKRGKK